MQNDGIPKIKIIFQQCIQDSQEYGSNDEHMISRAFFTIEVNGQSQGLFFANLKQTVGTSYETGPVEVAGPFRVRKDQVQEKYRGPFNYTEFRNATEAYYRQCVGCGARGIRIHGGSNIRMMHNILVIPYEVLFEAEDQTSAW